MPPERRSDGASSLRKLAFSVCLAVAFLGVGWLGMQLAGDADAEVGPNPAPATTTAVAVAPPVERPVRVEVSKPVKVVSRVAPPRTKPWAERASTHCARALQEGRAIVDNALARDPAAMEEEYLLGVLEAALRVDGRLLNQLEALPVQQADRRQVREALGLLERQFRAGEGLVAALKVRWDDGLIDRTDLAQKDSSQRIVQLFLGLGATGCAAYQQGPS